MFAVTPPNNGLAAWRNKSQMALAVLIITARGGGTWTKVMSRRDIFLMDFHKEAARGSCQV